MPDPTPHAGNSGSYAIETASPAGLLDRVRRGEGFTLTENGRPVARVEPNPEAEEPLSPAEMKASLAQLDASMDDIRAGRTRPAAESFAEGRRRLEERMAAEGIPGARA